MQDLQRSRQDVEVVSLNIDDLDVSELERRLEMAVAVYALCAGFTACSCPQLQSCGTYCVPK